MSATHCWADWATWLEEKHGDMEAWRIRVEASDPSPDKPLFNATCFLDAGHEGPHDWTPDSEIYITFTGDSPEPTPQRSTTETNE